MMIKSKGRAAALILAVMFFLPLFGCNSILDGEAISVSAHVEPSATSTDGVSEIETYDELKDCILSFIINHKDNGLFSIYSYDGDVKSDVERACSEIPKDDPIGSYAVSEMVGSVKQIISYYEVEVYIAYNDVTKEQLSGILTASSQQDLDYKLFFMLNDYAPYLNVITHDIDTSQEDAIELVSQIYYENPTEIVMMPVTTVEFYPNYGSDRLIEFTFGYRYEASTLDAMEQSLQKSVSDIAETVIGEERMQQLLLLTQRLMESTEYDEATATDGDYTNQNISATAYSALINGEAVSEGYAMAFKALCDALDIECTVVFGTYMGTQHVWNIVELDGDYYHIDVSNCDRFGLDIAFLKNDTDMENDYTWDTEEYKTCDGSLLYESTAAVPASVEASASAGEPEASTSDTPATDASVTDTPATESPADESPAVTEPDETPAD